MLKLKGIAGMLLCVVCFGTSAHAETEAVTRLGFFAAFTSSYACETETEKCPLSTIDSIRLHMFIDGSDLKRQKKVNVGDFLVAINGIAVTTFTEPEFVDYLRMEMKGTKARLVFAKDSEGITDAVGLDVELMIEESEFPNDLADLEEEDIPDPRGVGFEMNVPTRCTEGPPDKDGRPSCLEEFQLPSTVSAVRCGTEAAGHDVRIGDEIVSINGVIIDGLPTRKFEELRKASGKLSEATFVFKQKRFDVERYKTVTVKIGKYDGKKQCGLNDDET